MTLCGSKLLGRDSAVTEAMRAWRDHRRKGHPVLIYRGDRPQTGPRGGILKPISVYDIYLCCADDERD